MRRTICFLAVTILCPTASAQDPRQASGSARERGEAIARELRRRNAGWGDFSAELQMALRDADGLQARRAMRIRVLERTAEGQGDRSLVVLDSPSDLRGTALLSQAGVGGEDEQWLYLPSVHRVRRVSSGNSSGPFLGSEFSYEDITGGDVRKHSWSLQATERCPEGGQECFRLETRPRYEGSGYTRRLVWIDTAEYRVRQIDFYDRGNRLLKTLTYGDYRRYLDRYWRSHRWTMRNVQNGKSTVLSFPSYRFHSGLDESDFTRAALERAR